LIHFYKRFNQRHYTHNGRPTKIWRTKTEDEHESKYEVY